MRWILRLFLGLIGIAAAIVAVIYFVARSSLPEVEGEIRTDASLSAPVEILRDRNAIPHIRAATRNEAAFGLGFVHAQDRLWQMEINRRIASGRLAEVFGNAALNTDKFLRTLGVRRKAEAAFSHLNPETQAYLTAYADGVNAFLSSRSGLLPPEFLVFRIAPEPWTPADSLGWLKMMAWDLSGNWGSELARFALTRRLTDRQIEEFFPPYPGDAPVALSGLASLYREAAANLHPEQLLKAFPEPPPDGIGSNNWVIDGKRTVTGSPLLANDPHLGLTSPAIWYFARLSSPNGDVIGATLPGVPGVVLGHNGRVAWGFTNTGPDTQDIYIERVDPSDPAKYVTPDGSAPFVTRQEVIKVQGGDDITLTVRETRHGPVISDIHEPAQRLIDPGHVLAFAWTALRDDDTTADSLIGLETVSDWGSFVANFRRYVTPQQNIVYADRSGNIGFLAPGLVPVRKPQNELKGLSPAPGWDSRYDWSGFIPFDELPRAFNPPSGQIVTANHKIVPDHYPHFITTEWAEPYRAQRIEQLIRERTVHSVESFKQIQGDTLSLMAVELLPTMLAAPLKASPQNPELAPTRSMLAAWDATMAGNRSEPLVFQAWYRELTRLILADELGEAFAPLWRFRPILIRNILKDVDGQARWCANVATATPASCSDLIAEALDRALTDLKARYGTDMSRWRWGDAHLTRAPHRPFSNIPVLRGLFEVSVPTPGDAFTVNAGRNDLGHEEQPFANRHAASLRAVYDLADLSRSQFIHSTGQSGHPLSPFYRNFAQTWTSVQYLPMSLRPADIEAGAIGRLRVTGKQ